MWRQRPASKTTLATCLVLWNLHSEMLDNCGLFTLIQHHAESWSTFARLVLLIHILWKKSGEHFETSGKISMGKRRECAETEADTKKLKQVKKAGSSGPNKTRAKNKEAGMKTQDWHTRLNLLHLSNLQSYRGCGCLICARKNSGVRLI